MSTRMIARANGRNRNAMDPSVPRKVTPAVINTIVTPTPETIRIAFDVNVIPNKLPGFIAGSNGEATVESMTQISSTEVELVFSTDVEETDLVVSEGDPGIRTVAGGFVPAGTYAIPAVTP